MTRTEGSRTEARSDGRGSGWCSPHPGQGETLLTPAVQKPATEAACPAGGWGAFVLKRHREVNALGQQSFQRDLGRQPGCPPPGPQYPGPNVVTFP